MKYSKSYLIHLQFLGFRFSGWQKQTNAKTLHEMVDKSLSFVFEHADFKTLGIGRTDAKVSANSFYMQLFIKEVLDESNFLGSFNSNLPGDFKAMSIKEVAIKFNIIQASKIKEYHYYFSFGAKNHPFSAPFIIGFLENLDIEQMVKGAKLFEGEHYFHKYCTKPSEGTIFKRTIDSCEIVENTILTANFFPEKSYVLKVRGKGFLRYQIRFMMATLFELGKGNLDLQFIETSLKEDNDRKFLRNIAPSSGLQLYDIELQL
ncbi:tRNA pseudouridine(38-40) synthase TruA [Polaribacter litorisediminis]|uniref:tRNA pseudouridine(38-40) synthase TruA n=1 Tax=Polaribacter litorisediminis TaxID=1908341 RepID=UPI001CBB5DC7|nr:tRNA pseudouridine(38-40) synthase TruA [Polaribacter litorisediminis]UAM96820.1 tRNA pseudouridine(38-40) synthase TruA [Polaribacter litorisediminis]